MPPNSLTVNANGIDIARIEYSKENKLQELKILSYENNYYQNFFVKFLPVLLEYSEDTQRKFDLAAYGLYVKYEIKIIE